MDLLGDARSPESSNHMSDSSFEPYISAVSIFCGGVYKEQPYLSSPLPTAKDFRGLHRFSHIQKVSGDVAVQNSSKPRVVEVSAILDGCCCVPAIPAHPRDHVPPVLTVGAPQEADSCCALQGLGQDRGFLLGVYKSSKFWATL